MLGKTMQEQLKRTTARICSFVLLIMTLSQSEHPSGFAHLFLHLQILKFLDFETESTLRPCLPAQLP
jgi:hypothetical protein